VQKPEPGHSAFSTQFLSKVRTNDALIHVVRGFEDESVPHIEGSIDLLRDIKTFEEELIFSDMAFAESKLEKLEKDIQKQKTKDQAIKEIAIITKWNEVLSEGKPLRDLDFDVEEQKLIRNYQLLSAKPLLIALNLNETDIPKKDQIVQNIKNNFNGKNIRIEPFFAKIEMELAQLSDEEKIIFMEEYGLKDSAVSRLIRSAYDLLGLQSFFTVGEDECRAWTIKKGMTAQESAGVIHTDFYNKFIRAEVVHYNDFIECGSFAKCKEKGLFRLEGKEYILLDGDIMHIRHG
jgi:GTP-binding protein YchF